MSTVTPPPPPTQGPTAPVPQPTLTVVQPPPAVAALPTGTQLAAQVLAQPAKGQLVLQTPQGRLDVQTPIPLPAAATLTLQVQNRGSDLRLSILAVNGRPLSAPQAGSGAPVAATSAPAAGATAAAPPIVAGTQLAGILLRPAPPLAPGPLPAAGGGPQAAAPSPVVPAASAAGPGAQTMPAAAPAAALLGAPSAPAGAQPPAAPGIAASPSAPASNSGGTLPAAPTAAGAPPTAGPAPQTAPSGSVLPAGTQVPLRVVSVQPPGQPATPAPAGTSPGLMAGGTLAATVTGVSSGAQPVVQAGHAVMTLATPAPLAIGSTLVLEVVAPPTPPQDSAATLLQNAKAGVFQARDWPSLAALTQTVQSLNPALGEHLTGRVLPRPDAQLAANILMFLGALKAGDIGAWLGDGAMRVLQRAAPEILGRAREDFQLARRLVDEPTPQGDWRIALIPLLNEDQIEKIRMFYRPAGDPDDHGDKPGIRFVLDLELTRLGRMQLDGLVGDRGKRVDLIIRSADHLPAPMRADLIHIFEDAGRLTGLKGGVRFQAAPPNFIEVQPGSDAESSPNLVV